MSMFTSAWQVAPGSDAMCCFATGCGSTQPIARYSKVKRQLAAREWADMNDYAAAKTAVIEEITPRAERWASLTSWNVGA